MVCFEISTVYYAIVHTDQRKLSTNLSQIMMDEYTTICNYAIHTYRYLSDNFYALLPGKEQKHFNNMYHIATSKHPHSTFDCHSS